MVLKGSAYIRKYVFVAILLCAVTFVWTYVYLYYHSHESAIWLQIEEYAVAAALTFKVAELYGLPRASEIRVPVHGVVLKDIADTWGEARMEGRTHEGVDIFAKRGTPVYAADSGYIIGVGENNLGGTVVLTFGAGGVRFYYAHLESVASGIKVGREVTSDTVLGFVGNSGNASGTPPHLHFGVYMEGAENPYPLLVDR